MKQIIIQYNSTAALASAVANEPQLEAWKSDSYFSRSDKEQQHWAGETMADADRKLATGDKRLAKQIKAEGDILTTALGGRQPKIEVAVVGCVPSVPNYLRGVPANMLRVKREPQRNPVINIYVENSIYDGIDTEAVAQKAAIIANVIAATELAGVRVNLYAINTAAAESECFACVVKIKEAHSPLNLLNIAFPLCNRAMHRSIFMRWLERHSERRIFGYGRPMKGAEVEKELKFEGVVLSIRDMVDNRDGLEDVTRKINFYLKQQSKAK